jgi:hypothetical protein
MQLVAWMHLTLYPESASGDTLAVIQFQGTHRGASNRCLAKSPRAVLTPAKVVIPLLAARIEERK